MIKIENVEIYGWEAAIRGMRNPKNSWGKSDSHKCPCADWDGDCPMVMNDDEPSKDCDPNKNHFCVGTNDFVLMQTLANAGTDHGKFLRMITVTLDITAPLYWWKEFKTYRAGRKFGDEEPDIMDCGYLESDIEMNSCSTMHKIHAKEFVLDDFSHEHLNDESTEYLSELVDLLNRYRELFLKDKNKAWWWQMIQLLPSSYNQRRTVMLNYAVLKNMYHARLAHKLDEWVEFCSWITTLPYSELITGKAVE